MISRIIGSSPEWGAEPTGVRMSLRSAILPLLDRCFKKGGILGYHAVVEQDVPSPEMHVSLPTLCGQLEYVRDRYEVVPLRELVRRTMDGRSVDRCVAITFDDAYVGVESLAAPLLTRLDIPATVFVTVDAAKDGASFWWDRLEYARCTSAESLWPRALRQSGVRALPPSREALGVVREHLLTEHAGRLPGKHADLAEPPNKLLRSMDFDALARLARNDRFDFGSHTLTHPALPFLSGSEQRREMAEAQRRLAEALPRVVPIVAYPYGLYDGSTLREAASAGFRAAVTMQARALTGGDLALALPRIGVSEDWSRSAISLRLNAGMRPVFKVRSGTHPRLPARSHSQT